MAFSKGMDVLGRQFRDRFIAYLILAAVPPAAGLMALWLGQDNSWDLRNYHYYDVFAWLHGRMGFDVAVSHAATYYNPLLYLPFYHAVNHLPPRTVGFLLGLLQGCNVFPLFAIGRRLRAVQELPGASWVALAAALLGLFGAAAIAELGTSFADNVVSILVLTGLWLVLRPQRQSLLGRPGVAAALVSGLLCGAAFGFKQPFAVYAVGACAAFFGLDLPWRRRLQLAFIFGVGVLGGLAATGGFWMMEMWRRFQNPLFPYFNEFFNSPWITADSYRDETYVPHGLLTNLFFPLYFSFDPMRVGETPFRDLRLALLFGLLLIWLAKKVLSGFAIYLRRAPLDQQVAPADGGRRFLIIFLALSFVLWMRLFGVYRYLMVAAMLTPLALVAMVGTLVPAARLRLPIIAGCFALIAATLQPADWGRKPWGESYFGVQPPQIDDPGRTIVLSSGYEPMGYLIPFFPPGVRFLRIQGYMTGPRDNPHATDRLMQRLVAAHRGPLYILYRSLEADSARTALAFYGLEPEMQDCRTFVPSVEPYPEYPFNFCKVRRLKGD